MKKLLKVILNVFITALVLTGVLHLVSLLKTNAEFSLGFWQNLYSDLIAGTAIAYLIAWYINQTQTLDIDMIGFVEDIDNNEKEIRFSLFNKGKVGFENRQVYFHIMLDQRFEPFISDIDGVNRTKSRDGKIMLSINGLIDGPVYPKRNIDVHTIRLKNINEDNLLNEEWDIKYMLSTPKGVIPPEATTEGVFGVRRDNLAKVKYLDRKKWKGTTIS